jgi:electron transport complex protein RnfC
MSLRVVPTKYPSGGEKQLIQLLTGRQVPSRGLPIDIGLLMHNVGTAYAVQQAIDLGLPLTQRVVTVTGENVSKPGNYWVRLGTPVAHVLAHAGFKPEKAQKVIMGGPMMGFTLGSLQVPVVKISNCLLVPSTEELAPPRDEMPCIRCGACADVCPAQLLPQQLQWLAKAQDHDGLNQQNLFDCIECGACAYVCPSEIPLVHYYRKAKAEIRDIAREKAKSEVARERFEARQQRLEREKEERLERHRQAAEARQQAQQQAVEQGAPNPNDAVQAAIARAKARKAAQAAAAAEQATEQPAEPKDDHA